jgi:hypothetical protein
MAASWSVAGVEAVLACSGDSASHDCMAKTTATLQQVSTDGDTRSNELTSRSSCWEHVMSVVLCLQRSAEAAYLFRVKI